MINKICSVPSDVTVASDHPITQTPSKSKFGKKLCVAIAGMIAIAIIAIAVLVPQGSAIIPLNVNYYVGEKMVYDTIETMTTHVFNSTMAQGAWLTLDNQTINAKETIEINDFDGEYYSLNRTTTMTLNQKPFTFSMLEKVNKTGYSGYILNIGQQQISSNASSSILNPYLASLLNRSDVKVGDTWPVQLPIVNSSFIQVTGDLMITFQGFEDITVPAGTYRVFRVDIGSHDLTMHVSVPQNVSAINSAGNVKIAVDGQMYMECGTLRQIKSTMQETLSYESAMMNYTMGMTMEMTLSEHTKP